ncbi:unnamed protein product [Victoria cruziana]
MDSPVVGVLHKQRCCTVDFSGLHKGDCSSCWPRKGFKWNALKTFQSPRRIRFSNRQAFAVLNGRDFVRSHECEWGHHISRVGKKITLWQRNHSYPSASWDQTYGSEPETTTAWASIRKSFNAFYRFSRPHTVIGTAISIVSVSLVAVESLSDFSPLFVTGLMQAVVPALFMNIYIVGLNQLFDIEIDKINKPNLPLASGEYSVHTGIAIIVASACLSFLMGSIIGSWPLFWALFISFILGTAYSTNLPFLRWKRNALIAASCILAVRAVIVQLAFFMHMQDIPDIEGDRIFGIRSFSVRLGQKRVFWLCIYLLQMAYAAAIVAGAASSCLWSKVVMVTGHGILASILWLRAQSLDLKSKVAITSFYMFIWKLFYAEYLLIPLVR